MPTITFRSPVAAKLHPATSPVPPAGEFRVTQRFADRDFYYGDGRPHNAVDIGNFRCGDPILAMAPGIAYRIKDNASALGAATDALGVKIDHGYGITSEYWHLARQDVYDGQPVNAGFQIGLLGATGLGAVCHTHIEVKRNGVRIDPEPLMFGGSLDTEEDVNLPAWMGSFIRGTVAAGNRLRVKNDTTEGSLVLDQPAAVQVLGLVPEGKGSTYTLGGKTGSAWMTVGYDGKHWEVAAPLVGGIELTPLGTELLPPSQGYTQAQLDAAKKATADKAEAQTQAWIATRAPIKP